MDPNSPPVALVTGASSGIGEAVARMLHRDGYRVAVTARRAERLHALAAELGERLLPCPADLRAEDDILSVFHAVRTRFGGVDVLVNNAGLGHAAPLSSGSTEQWREMLEVNVLALAVCTREAVRSMRDRDVDGHIVHISSMSAHRVPPGSGMYSATKFAVRSLTEGLRKELRETGSGIRVSSVSPGFVRTEFAEHFHQSAEKAAETYGRYTVLSPDDVAEAVRYMLQQPAWCEVHDLLLRPTDQPT